MQKVLEAILKVHKKSIDIIIKSDDSQKVHKNLWSYPKRAQKIYRYSIKSTKIFEAILKVHKKSLDIIRKSAQKSLKLS